MKKRLYKYGILLMLALLMLWWLSASMENFAGSDIKTKTKIKIKSKDNKYLSICEGNKCGGCCVKNVCLTDTDLGDASTFELYVHDAIQKTVSIKGISADWLFQCEGCCDTCENIICADSGNVTAENGIFTLVENNGKHLLRGNNKQYIQLCAGCSPKCELVCTKPLENLDNDNLGLEFTVVA